MSAAIGSCAAEARLAVCMTRWSRPAGPSKPRPEAGPSGTGLASGSQSATPLTRPASERLKACRAGVARRSSLRRQGAGPTSARASRRMASRAATYPLQADPRLRHGRYRAGRRGRREEGRHPCRARGGPCHGQVQHHHPAWRGPRQRTPALPAGPAWRRLRLTPGSTLPATRTERRPSSLKTEARVLTFQPWEAPHQCDVTPTGEQSCFGSR